MSRLQKRCLFGSVAIHTAAIAFLVFGAAFVSKKPPQDLPPSFDVFKYKPTDENILTGGNPTVVEPPPQLQAAPPEPPPKAPQAEPRIREPEVEPVKQEPKPPKIVRQKRKPDELPASVLEPVKKPAVEDPNSLKRSKTKEQDVKDQGKGEEAKKTEKPKIKVNLDATKRQDADDLAAKRKASQEKRAREIAEAETAARTQAEQDRARLLSRLGNAASRIRGGISSPTTVEMPGPGGEAFANYGLIIRSFFNELWRPPDTAVDDSATVTAEIVLRKDGSVVSAVIIKKSGSPALDRSVQNALDRSKTAKLPPFPEGAKEDQRTFRINFNLKAKQQTG